MEFGAVQCTVKLQPKSGDHIVEGEDTEIEDNDLHVKFNGKTW